MIARRKRGTEIERIGVESAPAARCVIAAQSQKECVVALTARAEDLQYLSLAQAWQLPDPTPAALEAELWPRSTPNCTLTWNLEAPKNYYQGDAARCLGHCWTLGMKSRTPEGVNLVRVREGKFEQVTAYFDPTQFPSPGAGE